MDGFLVETNGRFLTHNQKKKSKSKKYANGYEVSIDNVVYESISKAADSLRIGHETARMRFKSKSFPNYQILSR